MECNSTITCMKTPSFDCNVNGKCECTYPKMWDYSVYACDLCVKGYTKNGNGAPCSL